MFLKQAVYYTNYYKKDEILEFAMNGLIEDGTKETFV